MAYSMTTAAVAIPANKTVSIRNRYVLLGSISATCAGIAYFLLRPQTPPGWLALALSVVCIWVFLLELRGVSVKGDTLSFAHRPLRWLPIICTWRRHLPLKDLEEITSLRPWLNFEVVLLEGQFEAGRLLFHSRNARLKFFETVKARAPAVRIYRTR